MDILVRSVLRAGAPLLEIWRQDLPGKLPLVWVQHGYMGRKEFILPQAYLMAANGFFVIAPDAADHGDRQKSLPQLFASIRATALEINQVLAMYETDARTDVKQAGYIGYSMGGMIAFYYLTLPQVLFKALCPVIATPDFAAVAAAEETKLAFSQSGLGTEADYAEQLAAAKADNPADKQLPVIPLLIQAGAADPLIPPASLTQFYEKARLLYHDANDLQLHIYPGQGHADTIEMNQKAVVFLQQHLAGAN